MAANFSSAASTITIGATNVMMGSYYIGGFQIAAGAGSLIGLIPTIPQMFNLLNQSRAPHTLLPASLTDDEIVLQSKLIALYCILNNKELFGGDRFSKINEKEYIHVIQKFVLQTYHNYDHALSTVINNDFKMKSRLHH